MLTEEIENVRTEDKEEEDKSAKREVERERERVEVNSKRVCLEGFLSHNFRGEGFEVFSDSEGVSVLLSECVPVGVCDLTVSSDVECDVSAVLSLEFQLNPSVSQTLSFSEKRGSSGTLSVSTAQEGKDESKFKAVPESMRKRPRPQVSPTSC